MSVKFHIVKWHKLTCISYMHMFLLVVTVTGTVGVN